MFKLFKIPIRAPPFSKSREIQPIVLMTIYRHFLLNHRLYAFYNISLSQLQQSFILI
nr:MAG TPA: hypothetical protein [Caudoviricetes sp.]